MVDLYQRPDATNKENFVSYLGVKLETSCIRICISITRPQLTLKVGLGLLPCVSVIKIIYQNLFILHCYYFNETLAIIANQVIF